MADPCETCGGAGVLLGRVYVSDGLSCFDVDHIARCDSCARYAGDLQAAIAVAQQQEHGAWVVWAVDFDGYFPSTEEPQLYVRATPGEAASLQLSILQSSETQPEVPGVLARVRFIEQGEVNSALARALTKDWYAEHLA